MYNYKRREIDLIMKNNGFELARTKGSHKIYKNSRGQHASVGMCHCNGAIMHKLSKQYNLDLSLRN